MPLTKIEAENFTVFENVEVPFCSGLNVLVGENGMGKTHIMKLAYAACQASKHDVSFSQKTTMLFRPDQSSIGRLVNRNKNRKNTAEITVESDMAKIIGIDLPNFVELEVTDTPPGEKGNTATGGTKPATLETGAIVNVPFFINVGDKIRVDTRTNSYLDRA